MKRESTNKPGTVQAGSAASQVTRESATVWGKQQHSPTASHPGLSAAAAPPPDWARYIDSRLKQFCTR